MSAADTYRTFSFGFSRPELGSRQQAPKGLELMPTGFAMVDGPDSVRQALLLLLSTAPGERVMRPTFGCDLHRVVFSPNNDTTAGLAMHYVRQAIERWEPRVEVLRVDAGRRRTDSNGSASQRFETATDDRLYITVDYRLRLANRIDRITVSLDLTEGTG